MEPNRLTTHQKHRLIAHTIDKYQLFIWKLIRTQKVNFPALSEYQWRDAQGEAWHCAVAAICEAAERFEPSRGHMFSTYFAQWVRNYVRKFFIQLSGFSYKQFANATAKHIELKPCRQLADRHSNSSDALIHDSLLNLRKQSGAMRQHVTWESDTWDAIESLIPNARWRYVWRQRYRLNQSQVSIARSMKISRSRVQQILTRSVAVIRSLLRRKKNQQLLESLFAPSETMHGALC